MINDKVVGDKEKEEWKELYYKEGERYRAVSKHIMDRLLDYKRAHSLTVRIVFSREPMVKSFGNIIEKIEKRRKEKDPTYGYGNLPDIIAVTVLCPYKSDTEEFIPWLENSFDIIEQEYQDNPLGHRGYHYTVTVPDETALAHPDFRDVRCEIQVKTILEEAFDAKSHDLTFKERSGPVDEELKNQFGVLSSALKGIDEQSEFLKDLIMREERELELRREAATLAYLAKEGTMDLVTQLFGGADQIEQCTVSEIASVLRAGASKGLSGLLWD